MKLQQKLKMMTSTVFDSKFTNKYISTDTHPLFSHLCDQISNLQEHRIPEKLARPIHIDQKRQLMREINGLLNSIGLTMREIHQLSYLLKGKDSNIIKDSLITAEAWKSGIRKIQIKLSNFYSVKMKYFSIINKQMQLDLELVELDEKEWAKNCLSKMTVFCICG